MRTSTALGFVLALQLGVVACQTGPQDPGPRSDQSIPPDVALPVPGVDLGITDDETYKRPNSWAKVNTQGGPTVRLLAGDVTGPASRPGLSIAWRNAAQIEEVEVRVQNLGDRPGEGRVWVDILDETGRALLHLEPPDDQKTIRLPAYSRGGREGKILRMKASRELNNLIDRYDRERRRYDVRATVATVGADANPFNNRKTKSWNVPFGVDPGHTNVFNYVFQNHEDRPVRVRWLFEHTPYPPGWKVEGVPQSAEPFVLAPGQAVRGSLMLHAPDTIEEGAFVESRLSLVDVDMGSAFQQREWFQVYDTIPPHASNYRMVFTEDHRLAIQVLVADEGSGVLEATGVSTEYSTDGGRTWSRHAHNYKAGNFVRPTKFEAVLGPFLEGTRVQVRLTAMDTAGNVQSVIPSDAVGIFAPSPSERLLEVAYIFPRLMANPLYELQPGPVDLAAVVETLAEKDLTPDAARDRDQVLAVLRGADEPAQVLAVPLTRVTAAGEEILRMTTLEVAVR